MKNLNNFTYDYALPIGIPFKTLWAGTNRTRALTRRSNFAKGIFATRTRIARISSLFRIATEKGVSFRSRRTDTCHFIIFYKAIRVFSTRHETRIKTATILAKWLIEGTFLVHVALRLATFVRVTAIIL